MANISKLYGKFNRGFPRFLGTPVQAGTGLNKKLTCTHLKMNLAPGPSPTLNTNYMKAKVQVPNKSLQSAFSPSLCVSDLPLSCTGLENCMQEAAGEASILPEVYGTDILIPT